MGHVRARPERGRPGRGRPGLPRRTRRGGRAEVGYDLAESARGHGYATEALGALAARYLARDDVKVLFAVIDRDNAASQRVVARAGFTRVSEDADQFAYELTGPDPALRVYARED